MYLRTCRALYWVFLPQRRTIVTTKHAIFDEGPFHFPKVERRWLSDHEEQKRERDYLWNDTNDIAVYEIYGGPYVTQSDSEYDDIPSTTQSQEPEEHSLIRHENRY